MIHFLLGQARTEEVMMLGTADVALEEASEISYSRRFEGPEDPRELQRWGFIYLFIVEALLLMRLMLDPLMVRRPLLDPNDHRWFVLHWYFPVYLYDG